MAATRSWRKAPASARRNESINASAVQAKIAQNPAPSDIDVAAAASLANVVAAAPAAASIATKAAPATAAAR
jgi:hypothetical protein